MLDAYNPPMHMKRQLRNVIVDMLDGIDGVCVLNTHRISVAAALAAKGERLVIVYHVAELPPQRTTNAIQGARPGVRGFSYGIAVVTNDDDAENGAADEVQAETERRLFADDTPLRRLATRDVVDEGAETNVIEGRDEAVATIRVITCHVPMIEGVPDRKA